MFWLLLALCTSSACSNDPAAPCDQTIVWDAVTPAPDTYEVGRAANEASEPETCRIVNGDLTTTDLTGSPCLDDRDRQVIRVRACNGSLCGGWSIPVRYDPTSCLEEPNCERPCCPGSAFYLPERYEQCP